MKKFSAFLILCLSALIVFACGTTPEPTVSSSDQDLYGIGICSTDAQCRGVSQLTAGYCADVPNAKCAPGGYCYFPVNSANPDCHCIVGDERECPAGGFQTCFQPYAGGDWPTYANGGCDHTYDNFTNYPPTTTCTGTVDCDNMAHRPECASFDIERCATAGPNGKECIWTLDSTLSGCSCVERSIRDCTKTGGAAGHQTCVKTSTAHTSWNTCS